MKPDSFHIHRGRGLLTRDVLRSRLSKASPGYGDRSFFAIFHDVSERRVRIPHVEEGHVQNGLRVVEGELNLRLTKAADLNLIIPRPAFCHEQKIAAAW